MRTLKSTEFISRVRHTLRNYNRLVGAEAGGWKRAIRNTESNQYAEVNYNYIELSNAEGGHVDQWGIEVHDSEIIGDVAGFDEFLVTVMVVRFGQIVLQFATMFARRSQ